MDEVAAAEARILAEINAKEEMENARRYVEAIQSMEEEEGLAAPGIDFRPIYEGSQSHGHETTTGIETSTSRVQDSDGFAAMTDSGWCLSLHQPHASLLIRGIKRHEGRNWGSDFRGPLWIHAGGKPIPREEVAAVEDFYKEFYGGQLPAALPIQYPTGCIVGQVTVREVLAKEEYDEKYPEGESGAPFVFICEDPMELPFHIPTPGAPKVFRLPSNIKQALAKARVLAKHY